jgi:hypothetical protein
MTRELGLISKPKLYDTLLNLALKGDPDCGGLLAYGYVSGEHITHFTEGRPLVVRSAQNTFNLANFMRVRLFTPFGALRTGLNILFEKEGVEVDEIRGHGGFLQNPRSRPEDHWLLRHRADFRPWKQQGRVAPGVSPCWPTMPSTASLARLCQTS